MSVIVVSGYSSYATYPLNHARIGYENFGFEADWSASSFSDADFAANNLANPITASRWRADANTGNVVADLSSPTEFDYVGIAGHNLGAGSHTVTIEHSDNGTSWTTISSTSPANNDAILFLFSSVTKRYLRVSLSGGTAPPSIGVVYVGKVLEMERPFYGGHVPLDLAPTTVSIPRRSESGHFLGRVIRRRGTSNDASWKNLTASWVRTNFEPFMEAARCEPFFFAWNVSEYPESVNLCWTDVDSVRPSNMGQRDLMQVSMPLTGLAPDFEPELSS